MTKFIGLFLFMTWTGISVLVGYKISKNAESPGMTQPHPVVVENVCQEPKERIVYLVPHIDYGDDLPEDDYEDECDEDFEEFDWRELKPRVIVKESKQKNHKQVMLGIQSSGNFEAKFNVPVTDNLGVYMGADTGKNLSIGASFSF